MCVGTAIARAGTAHGKKSHAPPPPLPWLSEESEVLLVAPGLASRGEHRGNVHNRLGCHGKVCSCGMENKFPTPHKHTFPQQPKANRLHTFPQCLRRRICNPVSSSTHKKVIDSREIRKSG